MRYSTQTGMEPVRGTEDRLQLVLEECVARELLFLHPEQANTRADVEAMLDAGFWEIGASGQCYSRAAVLDVLDQRRINPRAEVWDMRDVQCREIAQGSYVLIYTLVQGARITRRATIWRHTGEAWQALFHQGTIVDAHGE